MQMKALSSAERAYLTGQRLGRLATVAPDGTVQNNPVTFFLHADDTIDIGGGHMGDTKKFRNVSAGSRVSLVVDDVAPGGGWNPRMVEIRGTAQALSGVAPPADGFSTEVIRITPDRVISFGLPEPGAPAAP
jgi:pyridoxamine 5'-phosphate oxidase family protein